MLIFCKERSPFYLENGLYFSHFFYSNKVKQGFVEISVQFANEKSFQDFKSFLRFFLRFLVKKISEVL